MKRFKDIVNRIKIMFEGGWVSILLVRVKSDVEKTVSF